MSAEAHVGNFFLSASYNIILQVLVRVVSSVSNAIIFRFVSKDILGVINVRLLLLYSTCHCLSREAFRRSCMSKFDAKSARDKFNLLWMIVPLSAICAVILRYIWLNLLEQPHPELVTNYATGVNVVLLSVLIESLSEPLYVFGQSFYFVKLKVVSEGVMLTVRSFVMMLCLSKWTDEAMYCFCFSQFLSSIAYTCVYYGYFGYYFHSKQHHESLPIVSLCEILPSFVRKSIKFEDLSLTWSFFKQTLLKQLLTEGERYIMTFFNLLSFAEQGLYDVVNNLGSLAARFIFLPIEDSAYLLFTQMLSRDSSSIIQDKKLTCLTILTAIVKLMILLGSTILIFGYSYSQLLLFFYGGSKLSQGLGLTLMRWHCVYILLIAVNGVTEGFKFAVMSTDEINKYNKKLLLLSAGFLTAAYCLVSVFGAPGFIVANSLNMLFRILHNLSFLGDYFHTTVFELMKITCPNATVIFTLLTIMCFTGVSEANLCCGIGLYKLTAHLIFGGVCFLCFLTIVWYKERNLISFVRQQWSTKKVDKDKPL